MAYSDRELLARIIKCEAGGEGDTGMRAVASVIMNRVNVPNGEYQRVNLGDIRRVIMQKGQFDCATDTLLGNYNPQNIYNSPPEDVHYAIADWALAGNALGAVGDSLWYFNPYGDCITYFPRNRSGVFYNRINQHCFYSPTPQYAQT